MKPELAAFLSQHKWEAVAFLAGLLAGGIIGRL